jgi:hypothetical protein
VRHARLRVQLLRFSRMRRVPKACCTRSVVPAARRIEAPPRLRRQFSSALARDEEQEAMHQAIRESVQSLCK